jgi:glycerophosphoryl diester phosphodiesterase
MTRALYSVLLAAALYLPSATGAVGQTVILAHRGLHQDFRREGLTQTTCTAARMLPPTHAFLENTLPSIGAALRHGADVVEVDVHPTTDGEFAVFHDWTLDCRTDGLGVTRGQTMSYLRTLDIGWGYTADGGKTYPFRGRFKGAMPTLQEVVRAFPRARFLVNVKSNDPAEGDRLASYIESRRIDPARLMVYGGDRPLARLKQRMPGLRTMSRESLSACLKGYLVSGLVGRVPAACRDSVIFVPVNLRHLAWGWPNGFVGRMRAVNSEVFLVGPLTPATRTQGGAAIDDPAQAARLAAGYAGGISTDRIERVGPAVRAAEAKRLEGRK